MAALGNDNQASSITTTDLPTGRWGSAPTYHAHGRRHGRRDTLTPMSNDDDRLLDPVTGPSVGVIEVTDRTADVDESLWTDDSGEDLKGWYCISTEPWPCPADACGFVAKHITAAHLVICWPEMDDPTLLTHAQIAKDVGRNPRVIEYQTSMGPACSYYQWIAAGRPVHGIRGGGTQGASTP